MYPRRNGQTKEGIQIHDFFFILNYLIYFRFYRVAVTPAVTATLVKKGFTVNVESKAGFEAKFRDSDYTSAGGNIVDSKKAFDSGIIFTII